MKLCRLCATQFGMIAIILLTLTACNLPQSVGVPFVGTPVPTATATATPTPIPSPTPTPLPEVFVSHGDVELINGDWDSAETAFRQVLDNPDAPPDARGNAQVGLAEVASRRGDFQTAVSLLGEFFASFPGHPRTPQAYFLRGDARLGVGDWLGAISDYQQYLSFRPGLIDSYVDERIADAQLALGQTDQALQTYQLAADAPRVTLSSLRLHEKVANIARTLNQPDVAIAQYQAILLVAGNDSYRATIEFQVGQTLFEAGRNDEAYSQLNKVFMTYPDSFEAWDSLRTLLDAGQEVDQYQRGLVNYNQQHYEPAIEGFLNYWAATRPSEYTPESYLLVARSYQALGNSDAALTQLQVMLTRFKPDQTPLWGEAWLEVGKIQASQSNNDAAFNTYDQLVKEHPELSQAADALYLAGQLAESLNDLSRANTYYEQLAGQAPSDARSAEGFFRLGLRYYRGGDPATAATLFDRASKVPGNTNAASSLLWLGKSLASSGDAAGAATAFDAARSVDPGGYYGLRAEDLAAGHEVFKRTVGNVVFVSDPDEGRAEAEQWLISTFGLDATVPLADGLRGDIASDPRMIRAIELWGLGIASEARLDFEDVRTSFQDDPLATYQLAIYFRDIGLYRSSILATGRILTLSNTSALNAPKFIARLRYPVYFSQLVTEYSSKYNLDPVLVYAVIWQESAFEGFATSSASAQGLMQIWPPTGEDIAKKVEWPNYSQSDLQRPIVSLAFGTWLLNDELQRFDGDIYATLAAYNAGTGRASDWKAQSNNDPDLYFESISLSEPQRYIRFIYEHYAIYSSIYGGQ